MNEQSKYTEGVLCVDGSGEAREIVLALAAVNQSYIRTGERVVRCGLCFGYGLLGGGLLTPGKAVRHRDSCPLICARKWVEQHKAEL